MNTIVLITDRETDYLKKHWFDTKIILVAESGALYHQFGKPWQSVFDYDSSWLAAVAPAINALAFQYDGTFVEQRNTSIAWYYANAKKTVDYAELRQVTTAIRSLGKSNEFTLHHGEGFLELYTKGIDPGSFMARWIGGRQYDFILSVAESRVDETMFGLFTGGAFLVRVSHGGFTHSNHVLDKQEEVVPLLASLL
jgi:trehalose 6-phosphate synthase/phosphatase